MTSNNKGMAQKTRKLVVVGDGMSGKTCLLFAFKGDPFDPEQPPTIFDTYPAEVEVDKTTVSEHSQ
jgi:GTPase SAR1 family protein